MPDQLSPFYDPNQAAAAGAFSTVAKAMFGSPEQDAENAKIKGVQAETGLTQQKLADLQRVSSGRDSIANILSGVNDYSNLNQLKVLMPAVAQELSKSGVDPATVFETLRGATAYGGGSEADLYRANAALGTATKPGTAYTFPQAQTIRAQDFANDPKAVEAGIMTSALKSGALSPVQSAILHGGTAASKPIEVGPADLDAFLFDVANSMGGLTQDKNPVADPSFLAQLPPENLNRAKQIFGDTFQATNNFATAEDAAMKALAIPPGAMYQQPEHNWLSPNVPAAIVDKTGEVLKFNSPTVGQGAAAPVAPAALPPMEQRKPGLIYQTPKGPMTWTPEGWEPATGQGS